MPTEYVFHQSWLSTFYTCPEQARLEMTGQYPRDETEAAAKGTAVHAAIEAVLMRNVGPDEALPIAFATFRDIAAKPEFRWVKVKTEKTALEHIEGGFFSWYDHVLPELGSTVWVEQPFRHLLYEGPDFSVYIAGTIDYYERGKVKDWKLTQNTDKYGRDSWQLKRWSLQATTYGTAIMTEFGYDEVEFEFVALNPMGHRPQVVPMTRNREHSAFLRAQLISVAEFIERNGTDKPWPLSDQHALCSPKWCLNWDNCKGLYVAA